MCFRRSPERKYTLFPFSRKEGKHPHPLLRIAEAPAKNPFQQDTQSEVAMHQVYPPIDTPGAPLESHVPTCSHGHKDTTSVPPLPPPPPSGPHRRLEPSLETRHTPPCTLDPRQTRPRLRGVARARPAAPSDRGVSALGAFRAGEIDMG